MLTRDAGPALTMTLLTWARLLESSLTDEAEPVSITVLVPVFTPGGEIMIGALTHSVTHITCGTVTNINT